MESRINQYNSLNSVNYNTNQINYNKNYYNNNKAMGVI